MKNFQGNQFVNPDGTIKNQPKLKDKIEWVEREENTELKEELEKADKLWFDALAKSQKYVF